MGEKKASIMLEGEEDGKKGMVLTRLEGFILRVGGGGGCAGLRSH